MDIVKVWLIESGSYSDYGVFAVCATEEEAQRVVAKLNAAAGNDWEDWYYSSRHVVTADDLIAGWMADSGFPWTKEEGHDFDAPPGTLARRVYGSGLMLRQEEAEFAANPHAWKDADGRTYGVRVNGASSPEKAEKIARDALMKARAEELGL